MYNGYKNRETWNVALWLQNDNTLYTIASAFMKRNTTRSPYRDFIFYVKRGIALPDRTPDGVNWLSHKLSYRELNEVMRGFYDPTLS